MHGREHALPLCRPLAPYLNTCRSDCLSHTHVPPSRRRARSRAHIITQRLPQPSYIISMNVRNTYIGMICQRRNRYRYSYDISHTNTQGSPQRSWRPRGRQATSATRTCSINCARPPTSAAPYGSPALTPLLHPTPTPPAPHTSALNTPHSSSHYNSVTSMLLTHPLHHVPLSSRH